MSKQQITPFTPPYFTNFGKSASDLFKKKYDYDHTFKVINRSADGVLFESNAVNAATGLRGLTKVAVVPRGKWGKVEAEIHTDPAQVNKLTANYVKLQPGLVVTGTVATKDKDSSFKKPVMTGEIEYSADYVSFKTIVKSDTDVHKADVSAAVGFNNISIGGLASISGQGQLSELNYGAEYVTPSKDLLATLVTEKNQTAYTALLNQRITPSHSVAAAYKYELSGKRSLTLGTEFKADADTLFKAKVEVPTGRIETVVEHRVANPRVLFGLAAAFKTGGNAITTEKFGITATVGDF